MSKEHWDARLQQGARSPLAAAAEPIEPRRPDLGRHHGCVGGRADDDGIRNTLRFSPVLTAGSQPLEVASKGGAHLGLVALLLHPDLVPRGGRDSSQPGSTVLGRRSSGSQGRGAPLWTGRDAQRPRTTAEPGSTVKQSPVDRIMKVGSIDFDTAGDESSDRFSFIGVSRPQDLRGQIMHARDAEKTSGEHDGQGGLA